MFDEVFQGLREATEASLKMQQDFLQHWTSSGFWPGLPSPQSLWLDKVRDFQKQWSSTVSDLARRHRQELERQNQALLESMEEALRTVDSSNPVEFRVRSEQLCRKTLDCIREISEAQLREFHDAMRKWTELVTKVGT